MERPRQQWPDAALVTLLTGKYTTRYQQILHDLIRLALVTGARLNELCELRTSDAMKREDGWWISIRAGKTNAAVRQTPVHEAAAHVIERRRKSADEYLFAGLITDGPDNKRSRNVSKAFVQYRRSLGLNEPGQVFHSFRNTCLEALEAGEVLETTAKLIVGHKRASLTFGGYSKGVRVDLRAAVNKLAYSADVMNLIRGSKQKKRRPR
jgi:integrase